MILKKIYKIPENLVQEAMVYAKTSRKFTSDRHDFHEGGLNAKERKMFEGKLGEKIFKLFLIDNKIKFEEDKTSYKEADYYDFILPDNTKIDVKTRTKDFHIRTLEIKEQFDNKPKDIYVSVRLFPEKREGIILGWFSKEDLVRINRIENNGYLDNYVIYDNELRDIKELFENWVKNGKIILHKVDK